MRLVNLLLGFCVLIPLHTSQADTVANRADFQRPGAIPAPPDNPLTEDKVALGKTLFFDPRLSRDGSMSCATCHAPDHRWSDGRIIPLGSEQVENARRTPTVMNSAWLSALMWDGRASSLEQQATLPITTPHEMNFDMDELVERLNGIDGYRSLFLKAFADEQVSKVGIAKALASFQRTLISPRAPFDDWVDGDDTAISFAAQRGFSIFTGKAQCIACHSSWRFTDDSFHDIGLDSPDLGRGNWVPAVVTLMQHAFKTPTLRDLPENGPFMHNGSMHSLEQVIEHYEQGGQQRASLSHEMQAFELNEAERKALIAFLKTLDGGPLTITAPDLPE
ncbi:cytochrome-c peroxidase [Methylophaga lonarensis MPL]|uniref:Methylamine utilization protein MauG n=1 Tax=Methylophaga lonarensis MPL TaxID=1286106 RepID=M7PJD6_9GAMM|nr:tryptophan tryptophylquinone biosynthesis enzyme MauG [Methylophaga lonarensis]EMR14010.1 cytochrome-c peroxidase [Methylophaga lonarensis MPL]